MFICNILYIIVKKKRYIMYISISKNIKIKNCKIHNGFSEKTEMIKVTKLSEVNIENIKIHDIYSHKEVKFLI